MRSKAKIGIVIIFALTAISSLQASEYGYVSVSDDDVQQPSIFLEIDEDNDLAAFKTDVIQFFRAAGLTLVDNEKKALATLRIKFEKKPLGASYEARGFLWTGAQVKISMTMLKEGKTTFNKTFIGQKNPREFVSTGPSKEDDPNGAPFNEALELSEYSDYLFDAVCSILPLHEKETLALKIVNAFNAKTLHREPRAAVRILGASLNPEYAEVLVPFLRIDYGYLKQGRESFSDLAKRSLLQIGPDCLPALEKALLQWSQVSIFNENVSDLLVELGPKSSNVFIKLLVNTQDTTKRLTYQQRTDAPRLILSCIAEIGEVEDKAPIVDLLQSSDERICAEAAYCLGRVSGREAVPLLSPLIYEKRYVVAASAAHALAAIQREDATDSIRAYCKRFMADSENGTRKLNWQYDYIINRRTLGAIGYCADPELIDVILALYDEENEAALYAAGGIESEEALQLLTRAVFDIRTSVAEHGVAGLVRRGDDKAVETIIAALEKRKDSAAKDMIEALSEIGTPTAILGLQECSRTHPSDTVRQWATDSLVRYESKQQEK